MHARDHRDLIGGALLIFLGLWYAIYAAVNFDLGTLSHMGPGMFPASLGFLLSGFGLLTALRALFRPGSLPTIDWRPFIFVALAVLAFALTVDRFGMIPAVVLLTVITAFSDSKLRPLGILALAASLSLLAYLIFRLGLGIVLEPFRWML